MSDTEFYEEVNLMFADYLSPKKDKLQLRVKNIDTNKDGSIDSNEMQSAYQNLSPAAQAKVDAALAGLNGVVDCFTPSTYILIFVVSYVIPNT